MLRVDHAACRIPAPDTASSIRGPTCIATGAPGPKPSRRGPPCHHLRLHAPTPRRRARPPRPHRARSAEFGPGCRRGAGPCRRRAEHRPRLLLPLGRARRTRAQGRRTCLSWGVGTAPTPPAVRRRRSTAAWTWVGCGGSLGDEKSCRSALGLHPMLLDRQPLVLTVRGRGVSSRATRSPMVRARRAPLPTITSVI